ncbi:hypothetical protein DTO013E5_3949 [Penicillium roqueforti]|uniref:uncharacterized protein n=1 Tax=Penicillium roqueforti TaxID=5082 RepID=UPI00190AFFFB|nr:uncharacterized protein LCP9604111_1620 [Penicillium roqueforti]KAF9251624.1 hypothetical protein LCP9604111_1620 [Penicillium roqueforti]KAI1836563.1 hypothetical protein CBS147337_2790 [Penicillium roqueforti]KAI2710864.1 hypothetical protein CBS147318_8573 [Penicillium roqueforti]KAI2729735.1 hypothetical protein CBS147354_1120 [Penicillium roqueforti]KAI2748122.1 hypothetical protein DTO012A1_768 [Penicillium roqueforti]
MRYTLIAPILLAVTALAVPVPKQNDVIGDAGVAVNIGGDKTAGVAKRGDGGGGHGGGSDDDDSSSDLIGKLGAAINVGGAETTGVAKRSETDVIRPKLRESGNKEGDNRTSNELSTRSHDRAN